MFNLSKEDDVRKYVVREREALHRGSQGPTSSYSLCRRHIRSVKRKKLEHQEKYEYE